MNDGTRWRDRLAVRVAGGFGCSVIVTLLLAIMISGFLLRRAERPLALYRRHLVRVNQLLLRELGDGSPAAIERFRADNPEVGVAIYREGRQIAGNERLPAPVAEFFQPGIDLGEGTRLRPWRNIDFTLTEKDGGQVVLAHRLHLFVPLVQRLMAALLVAIAIGYLLLYRYVRRLLAPVAVLVAATAAVQEGRFGHRITVPADSEFRQVFAAFNAMASRLEAMFANDLLLLGNLSHDLKFFLTRLRMTAEVEVPPGEARRSLLEDLSAIDTYLEKVMLAFRAGSRQATLKLVELDLAALAASLVAEFPAVGWVGSPAPGAAVTAVAPPAATAAESVSPAARPVVVRADPDALATILRNLLDNACRHGREPIVSLAAATPDLPDAFRLTVANRTDLGLPADRLGLLLQPFYRADPARSGPGSGLGLFIAHATAAAMGFALDLSLAEGRFTVTLHGPLACKPPDGPVAARN